MGFERHENLHGESTVTFTPRGLRLAGKVKRRILEEYEGDGASVEILVDAERRLVRLLARPEGTKGTYRAQWRTGVIGCLNLVRIHGIEPISVPARCVGDFVEFSMDAEE